MYGREYVKSRTRGKLAEKRTALKNDKRKRKWEEEERGAKEGSGEKKEAPGLISTSITNI